MSSLNLPVRSLKKTDNTYYLHHQRHANVFIVKLKDLRTLLVLVIVVALWNLLLRIKTLHYYYTTTKIRYLNLFCSRFS